MNTDAWARLSDSTVSDTQRVLERLIEALERRGFKIHQIKEWVLAPAKIFECVWARTVFRFNVAFDYDYRDNRFHV